MLQPLLGPVVITMEPEDAEFLGAVSAKAGEHGVEALVVLLPRKLHQGSEDSGWIELVRLDQGAQLLAPAVAEQGCLPRADHWRRAGDREGLRHWPQASVTGPELQWPLDGAVGITQRKRRQACPGRGTAQAPGSSSQKTSRGATATRNAWESKSPSPKRPTHPSPLQGMRV